MSKQYGRDYWRGVAAATGQPAWVVKQGFTQAADEIARMLDAPASANELAEQTGYEPGTIDITLKAMERVGLVRRRGSRWEASDG